MKFSLLLLFAISSTAFARGPAGTFSQAYGPLFRPQPDLTGNAKKFARDPVHRWNQIAIDATGLDHTPVGPSEHRTFGEQLGPGRASRAMAIVHVAIFDATNAAPGQYQSFTGIQSAPHPFSTGAAHPQAPPPPALTSAAYTTAYNEAKNFGGDGITTPTQRTPEQTFIGTFWAYDGTPSLCAPPRLYNQITVHIADQTKLRPIELARLLALVNVSMADAAMSIWESKYHYELWRPITGIHESDPRTGTRPAADGDDV